MLAANLSACLSAQDVREVLPATSTPSPDAAVCEEEAYQAFDFWIGEWEVFGADGQKAGDNRISRQEGSCLLLEEWVSAGGTTGQSYNFYNPGTDEWRQVWVSQGAIIDYSGNLTDTGSMRLEGEITYRNETSFPFTGEWTLQQDGSVLQHFEQYDPDAEVWNVWFTGTYKRANETVEK